MVKRQVSLYLDVDVVQRLQSQGVNISEGTNNYWQNYLESEEEVSDGEPIDYRKKAELLKVELAGVKQKLLAEAQKKNKVIEAEKEKSLDETIQRLIKLKADKMAGSKFAGDEFKALVDSAMIEFGLTRQQLMGKVF